MKSLADAVFPVKVFSLPLFHGISETGRTALVSSGWLRTCSFEKNQTIYHMGDRVSELGIVLSGSVFVENTDLWGNRSILSKITPVPGICRNVCLLSGADDGECHGSRSLDGSLFQSSKPRPDRRW